MYFISILFLLSGTICNTEAGPDQGFCEDINECLPGWVDPRNLVTVDGRTDIDGVRDYDYSNDANDHASDHLLRGGGLLYQQCGQCKL